MARKITRKQLRRFSKKELQKLALDSNMDFATSMKKTAFRKMTKLVLAEQIFRSPQFMKLKDTIKLKPKRKQSEKQKKAFQSMLLRKKQNRSEKVAGNIGDVQDKPQLDIAAEKVDSNMIPTEVVMEQQAIPRAPVREQIRDKGISEVGDVKAALKDYVPKIDEVIPTAEELLLGQEISPLERITEEEIENIPGDNDNIREIVRRMVELRQQQIGAGQEIGGEVNQEASRVALQLEHIGAGAVDREFRDELPNQQVLVHIPQEEQDNIGIGNMDQEQAREEQAAPARMVQVEAAPLDEPLPSSSSFLRNLSVFEAFAVPLVERHRASRAEQMFESEPLPSHSAFLQDPFESERGDIVEVEDVRGFEAFKSGLKQGMKKGRIGRLNMFGK